jgi:hypothetical protein
MGLDDSCCDFVSLYARKKIPLAQNIDMLLESLDWYTSQSDNYPTDKGSKLAALRRAAKRSSVPISWEIRRLFKRLCGGC